MHVSDTPRDYAFVLLQSDADAPTGRPDRDFGSTVSIQIANDLAPTPSRPNHSGALTLHPAQDGGVYLAAGTLLVAPQPSLAQNSAPGGRFSRGAQGIIAYAVPGQAQMLAVLFDCPYTSGARTEPTVKLSVQPAGPVDAGLYQRVADLAGGPAEG